MAKPVGTRHASGAKKFPNGWFIEREITRNGRVHRQWFRTRDPNAQPGPRGARRRAAQAPEPSALQRFADKVGLSHEAKRTLARLPADLRRRSKEDLLAVHRQHQAEQAARIGGAKEKSKPKGVRSKLDDQPLKTEQDVRRRFARHGVEVVGAEHAVGAMKKVFGRELTMREMRSLMALDSFKEHGLTPMGREGRPIMRFHDPAWSGDISFNHIGVKKVNGVQETADISRKYSAGGGYSGAGKPYVYHDHFFISKGLQGGGLGRSVLKEQLTTYKKLKMPEVRVYAVDVGRYYWRKIGFERESPQELERDKRDARDYMTQVKHMKGEVADRILSNVKTTRQLATLEVNGQKLGKEWATSSHAEGGNFRLDLKGKGWDVVKEEFGIED